MWLGIMTERSVPKSSLELLQTDQYKRNPTSAAMTIESVAYLRGQCHRDLYTTATEQLMLNDDSSCSMKPSTVTSAPLFSWSSWAGSLWASLEQTASNVQGTVGQIVRLVNPHPSHFAFCLMF